MEKRPKVGVGVLILKDGKVLMSKRKGTHGPGTWCPPGGHLEFGETIEACARRETKEEAGIEIKNVRVGTITNDVHHGEGKHYITVVTVAEHASGEPQVLEPHKAEKWEWVDWNDLPAPLFLSIANCKKQGFDPRNSSGILDHAP